MDNLTYGVQSMNQIANLNDEQLTYIGTNEVIVGNYRLVKGVVSVDNDPSTIISPSLRLCSVTQPTYYLSVFGVTGMVREYLQYKLDSYVIAKTGIDRGYLFLRGIVCASSTVSQAPVAMLDNTLRKVGDIDDTNSLWHYNIPSLGGLNDSIGYDPYQFIHTADDKWIPIHEFAHFQQYLNESDVKMCVKVITKLNEVRDATIKET